PRPPRSPLFPYTTLFRSTLAESRRQLPPARNRRYASAAGGLAVGEAAADAFGAGGGLGAERLGEDVDPQLFEQPGDLAHVVGYPDRKSTRLNSSHVKISY